jgi:hypothetical protein
VAASVTRIFGGAIATTVTVSADTARVTQRLAPRLRGGRNVRQGSANAFLVATDTSDHLKDIDILVYREPYGGEVAYESWRRQFRGKTAQDTLDVGRQIRGISGATISVNAVTAGVRRALADLTTWHRTGAIN